MNSLRSTPRALRPFHKYAQRSPLYRSPCSATRALKSQSSFPSQNTLHYRRLFISSVLILGTGAALFHGSRRTLHAEAPPPPPASAGTAKVVDIVFEKPLDTDGLSKEENRSAISSQHHQVIKSWENPGVYAWGSNSGRVVAPDSDESFVKTPRRIPFFDGMLLRDIKLDRQFGAAVTETGDLLQWGVGYSTSSKEPVPTLKGKNLVAIEISRDRIIGLGSSGKVYSVPVSAEDQQTGAKPSESSWIPFWSSRSNISYRNIEIKDMGWSEKISSISSGLEHLLLLTSSGRLFSAASCSEEFPSRGEMGVPGLTWSTRPPGPYDQPHEITTLRGFEIAQIATGDYHSIVVDKEGRAFSFGDNTSGQLGFEPSQESSYIDAPSLLPISRLYSGTQLSPSVTSVAAGGANSFLTIDATRVAGRKEELSPRSTLGRITADTWSCGQGILGTLGNGRWTHIQGSPTKIKNLSGLFEYDETNNTVIPIRIRRLSAGTTHASAVMDNVTHLAAGSSLKTDSRNDVNWGADVVWWGGNEYFQLGTGKRNNLSIPAYIAPLDAQAEFERAKRKEQHRFQITPRHKVTVNGRRVSFEQRVECGRMVSAVYSGT